MTSTSRAQPQRTAKPLHGESVVLSDTTDERADGAGHVAGLIRSLDRKVPVAALDPASFNRRTRTRSAIHQVGATRSGGRDPSTNCSQSTSSSNPGELIVRVLRSRLR